MQWQHNAEKEEGGAPKSFTRFQSPPPFFKARFFFFVCACECTHEVHRRGKHKMKRRRGRNFLNAANKNKIVMNARLSCFLIPGNTPAGLRDVF